MLTSTMYNEKELLELYETHKRELLVYIYRLLGDNDAAEDILHDTFINFIKNNEKFEIKEAKAYLYRSSHNLAVNYIKKHQRVTALPDEVLSQELHYDQTEEKVVSAELQRKIDELLQVCDPEARSYFIMKKELGMSTLAIAEQVAKSERTVRRKIQVITDFLMKNLKKSGYL